MAPSETIVVDANPPAYPGGYGAIEVHHHHHHTVHARQSPPSACYRTLLVFLLIFLMLLCFGVVSFVAWNFYNLSECEKHRLPWEKPCKDWLGKDAF